MNLATSSGDVTIEFEGGEEYAASLAVASWLSIPLDYTIDEVLNLAEFSTNPEVVDLILYQQAFDNLRSTIEDDISRFDLVRIN